MIDLGVVVHLCLRRLNVGLDVLPCTSSGKFRAARITLLVALKELDRVLALLRFGGHIVQLGFFDVGNRRAPRTPENVCMRHGGWWSAPHQ